MSENKNEQHNDRKNEQNPRDGQHRAGKDDSREDREGQKLPQKDKDGVSYPSSPSAGKPSPSKPNQDDEHKHEKSTPSGLK